MTNTHFYLLKYLSKVLLDYFYGFLTKIDQKKSYIFYMSVIHAKGGQILCTYILQPHKLKLESYLKINLYLILNCYS